MQQHLGYGLPVELTALWRLCGGVEHQYIEENEEEGEVGSGRFLPGGVLFTPAEAVHVRLPVSGRRDHWRGARVVPWLTRDEAGPEHGEYVSGEGVGHWVMPERELESWYPSLAAYLETVHRTLTMGPADLMGSDVPGLVWGCLVWDDPESPALDDALGALDAHPLRRSGPTLGMGPRTDMRSGATAWSSSRCSLPSSVLAATV